MRREDREQLEARLLKEMREAEQAYRRAAADSALVLECYKDFPADDPHARTARRKALRAELAALRRWRFALRRFSDLVLRKPVER
jgi:hypothetical protein